MQHLSCYDDTNDEVEYICEQLDWTEPELIEALLDIAAEDESEVGEAIRKYIYLTSN